MRWRGRASVGLIPAETDRPQPAETSPEQAIGAAIRATRHRAGLSATSLAERAGLSQPFLSQLESGKASPSISTLYRIANALGTTPQQLLPADGDPLAVIRSGTAPARPIEDRPDAAIARMLFGRPDTTLQVQEVTVEEGQDLGGFFDHDGEELVYLLEGTIAVELQGRPKVEIAAGDAVWYRATMPHRWSLVGTAARILVVSAATTRTVHG